MTLDNGDQIDREFIIHQMPAMKMYRWIFSAAKLLVKAGVLNSFLDAQDALAQVTDLFSPNANHSILQQLGNIDDEAALKLIMELTGCAEIVGEFGHRQLDENTINNQLDLVTLFKVQVECFKLNFSFFSPDKLSDFLDSPMTSMKPTDKTDAASLRPKISVRSLARS